MLLILVIRNYRKLVIYAVLFTFFYIGTIVSEWVCCFNGSAWGPPSAMGVTGLWKLLYDVCPSSVFTNTKLDNYNGKAIAIDGNYFLYKSLTQNRNTFGKSGHSKVHSEYSQKVDSQSNVSLLLRTFHDSLNLLNNGIKPIYVFDGGRIQLKQPLLKKRKEKREEAIKQYNVAQNEGDERLMKILKPKTVKIGAKQVRNCRGLLKLMGIPYLFAPGEAEAQCAELVESGMVYAAATQDSDALPYGTKVVLRNFSLRSHNFNPIQEIHLDKLLQLLDLSLPQLVDLAIILGCDFCKGISGIGVHRALELLHHHSNIENILENIDLQKFHIPEDWSYKKVRQLYLKPKVADTTKNRKFKWKEPNEDGIVEYLQGENDFDEDYARRALQNLPRFEESSEPQYPTIVL